MSKLRLNIVLKQFIDRDRITLRELARVTKVPQSTLSAYLAGARTHKPEHILALARHFRTSMEMMLFAADERPPSLDEVLTEGLFEGWLKVKIERAVPTKRKVGVPDED